MRRLVGKVLAAAAAAVAVAFSAPPALAGNVDLVTLPPRASVQLTIYNSEDLTLAKETRFITFKKGQNRIQFSWANTLIDPTSLEFRVKQHQDKVQLLDATFPGGRPDVVIWNIESEVEGQVECEVSYFTSGVSWAMDYVGISDPAEKAMKFDGYVSVFNRSGEDYEGAEVRMVVGVVNLVEKIALLAQRRGVPVPRPEAAEGKKMRRFAMEDAMRKAEEGRARAAADGEGEKAVVKEGLSEYFIFSVEGTEDVPNGWSKRMRAVKTEKPVEFEVLYRFRDFQYGPRPARFMIWKNDKEHSLGESPLPDGVIRLFRDNGRDGLSFLGAQQVKYIPVKEKIEVNVGADDEVVYEQTKQSVKRHDFSYRRMDSPPYEYVVGWDETEQWMEKVRNYRDRPVKFEIRRQWPGDVELSSGAEPRAHDAFTVEFTLEVPARQPKAYGYTILRHQGENAKQNRVLVK